MGAVGMKTAALEVKLSAKTSDASKAALKEFWADYPSVLTASQFARSPKRTIEISAYEAVGT